MKQNKIKPPSVKTRELLSDKSADELSYILGRYCGKHNTLLSKKQFGFVLHHETVERMFQDRTLEQYLLSDN